MACRMPPRSTPCRRRRRRRLRKRRRPMTSLPAVRVLVRFDVAPSWCAAPPSAQNVRSGERTTRRTEQSNIGPEHTYRADWSDIVAVVSDQAQPHAGAVTDKIHDELLARLNDG